MLKQKEIKLKKKLDTEIEGLIIEPKQLESEINVAQECSDKTDLRIFKGGKIFKI